MDLSRYTTWQQLFNDAITVLQALISVGCGVRCILIIKKGRENEVPLSKSLTQCKKFIWVIALTVVIGEMVQVIGGYFN